MNPPKSKALGELIPKKSLGQNFLTSPIVPTWLCAAANLKPGDKVLEIGPGTGVLTKELLKREVQVTAVETDKRATAILKSDLASALNSGQLNLIELDIQDFTPSKYGLNEHQYKIVSNIPYYLSGWLLRTYLSGNCQPEVLIFLIQKELAERIARDPKSSLLSLSVKAYGEVRYEKTVGRGHFQPSPKVDSAILSVRNINRQNFTQLSEKHFFTLLHLGFGQRRKQLLGNLTQAYPRAFLETIFTENNLDLTVRGEDLDLMSWLKLAQALPEQK